VTRVLEIRISRAIHRNNVNTFRRASEQQQQAEERRTVAALNIRRFGPGARDAGFQMCPRLRCVRAEAAWPPPNVSTANAKRDARW